MSTRSPDSCQARTLGKCKAKHSIDGGSIDGAPEVKRKKTDIVTSLVAVALLSRNGLAAQTGVHLQMHRHVQIRLRLWMSPHIQTRVRLVMIRHVQIRKQHSKITPVWLNSSPERIRGPIKLRK